MSNINQKSVLSAHNLSKEVRTAEGQLSILSAVELDIKHGDCVAVVGASGSGKSTLLGLLAGLDSPSAGDVILQGKNLNEMDEDGRAQLRGQYVGFVFQSFHLVPSLTALENVLLPLELLGHKDVQKQAKSWLERVGLENRTTHYPNQLSGGEQQRVAIARAFSTQPDILFADEPTGNLDTQTGERIIELLFDLNAAHGTTLIIVTHDERIAARCPVRVHLSAGAISKIERDD